MDYLETLSLKTLELIDLVVLNGQGENVIFEFPSRGSRVRISSPAPVNIAVTRVHSPCLSF